MSGLTQFPSSSGRTIDLMPSTRRDQNSNGRSYDCPQGSENGFTEIGEEIESAPLAVIDSRANGQTTASADQESDQRISPAPPFALQLDPFDFRARERLLACGRVDGERIGRHLLHGPANCPSAG